MGRGDAREVVGVAAPEGGGVATLGGRTREYERRLPGSEPFMGVLAAGGVLTGALGIRVATLAITPDESGSSRMTMSESVSVVKSITSLGALSAAAFSASRCASAPDAHESSSRVRRSAAYEDPQRCSAKSMDNGRTIRTAAASSRGDRLRVGTAPPRRRGPPMPAPIRRRFSAASRVRSRAT